MKTLLLSALSLTFAQVLMAVSITNFGTSSWSTQTFGNDFTPGAQDASSLAISGTAANRLAGLISTTDITGNTTSLTVSGSFTSGSGAFSVQLFDSSFNSATFTGGSFTDLVSSGSTMLSFDSFAGAVALNDISAVDIIGAGSPATSVAGTLTGLEAVPEPSAYAALAGLVALGVVMVRRRA